MAFADYLDLRTAVIEQVGNPSVVDVFDRLTKLAENWLTRNLRMQQQLTETNVIVTNGIAALPDDLSEIFGVYDQRGIEVNQKTVQDLQDDPLADGVYRVQYYAKIPTLTASMTTTNWLLQNYPDVYLYAVSYEAARHLRDIEAAQVMLQMRDDAVMNARGADHRTRYARSRVRVAGVTP